MLPPEEVVSMLFQLSVLRKMSVLTQNCAKAKEDSVKHFIDRINSISIYLLIAKRQTEPDRKIYVSTRDHNSKII